jgi:uncharacterized protein (TIRG00374 family)
MTAAVLRSRARRWAAIALWIALSAAIIAALAGSPWQRALAVLRTADPWWSCLAIVMNAAILFLWAAEWQLLAPDSVPVSYGRMFEIVSITASVLNTIPFFAGETSAFALLVARGGLSAAAAASVLALDQLLVGVGKIAVIAGAALAAPLPSWLGAGVFAFCVAIGILATVLLVLAHRWQPSLESPAPRTVLERARSTVINLGRHLDALRSAHRTARAVALALLKKAAELGAILAIQLAFGASPSVAAGLLILAALGLSTIVPVTPANVGVYEATVFAVYRYLGVPADAALAMAAAQHLCFLVPSIAVGYLTLTLRQLPLPTPRAR